LERPQFTKKPSVAAVTDRAEVLGIKLGEKRITIVQVWIMRSEARFEHLATITYCFEPLARGVAATIVAAQIAQRLFAFEHCC